MRSICLGLLLFPLLVFASPAEAKDGERPNLLFIFLDDYGWRDCGFMGSDYYETPNLDQLASESVVFTNAYSASANCAPARACLLSGQYTPRHEIYNVGTQRRGKREHGKLMHVPGVDTLPTSIRTWASMIQDAGYTTGTIGKWHLSKDPRPYGFDVNIGGTHSGSPPRGYFPPHNKVPGLENAPKGEYLTDRLTDEAIGFIEGQAGHPWMLYLTHFAVHTPLQAKRELVQKYESKPKGELHNSAVMAAMIESVDDGVGRIVQSLKDQQLYENTIVVFTSDNGGYGPATSMAPLKGYKGTYYEGGIREPMFIRWPGHTAAGTTCETPVINVDLYPTFCEMLGVAMPDSQQIDGESLAALVAGEELPSDHRLNTRALYWHFPAYLQSYQVTHGQRDLLYRSRPCSIIRKGKWKLHEYFEDGGLELYDLKSDVSESTNLAQSQPRIAEQLHSDLVSWRNSINAPVPSTPNPHYDAESERKAIKKIARRSMKK